jgi:hypothetical protein
MKAVESREPRSGAIRPEQPIGSPALAQEDLKGKTLLVVEDEAVLRECEVQVLGSSGCRVVQAGCVAEALRVSAATAPIHLLLTDFLLPMRWARSSDNDTAKAPRSGLAGLAGGVACGTGQGGSRGGQTPGADTVLLGKG